MRSTGTVRQVTVLSEQVSEDAGDVRFGHAPPVWMDAKSVLSCGALGAVCRR